MILILYKFDATAFVYQTYRNKKGSQTSKFSEKDLSGFLAPLVLNLTGLIFIKKKSKEEFKLLLYNPVSHFNTLLTDL